LSRASGELSSAHRHHLERPDPNFLRLGLLYVAVLVPFLLAGTVIEVALSPASPSR
jgi:hypothetical protein